MQSGKTSFPATEARIGHGVRIAHRSGLQGVSNQTLIGALKGLSTTWQSVGHRSKTTGLLMGRTNQVVRRWSRQGDRNKRVLSRHVRGVRSTTFDIGPMSEVPHMPTSRGQRPAPAYIRLLSSGQTLCALGRVVPGHWHRSKTAAAGHYLAKRPPPALAWPPFTYRGLPRVV